MAQSYVKIINVVEAMKVTINTYSECLKFCPMLSMDAKYGCYIIHRPEGDIHLKEGDYILEDVDGDYYSEDSDRFLVWYRPIKVMESKNVGKVKE